MDRSDAQRPAPSGLRTPGRLPANERAQLLDEYRAGQPVAELADTYRINPVTLLHYLAGCGEPLHRAHVKPRQLPDGVLADLIERYGRGEDPRVLAAEHCLNPSTLASYANARGVSRRALRTQGPEHGC